ncbi:MAG: asparaginase, partial [Comamonadaceae bacterium]
MKRPRVLVLTLGGTISMTPAAGGGLRPELSADALLQAVPGLAEVAEVAAESHLAKPGASLSFDDLAGTAARIRAAFGQGVEGVVVVQGTDTIEDTAFVLDLLAAGPGPVVVTGAMRPPGAAGADGPANLLAAVRVAASPEARGCGVLVVLNDELHAARLAQKTHTNAT